MAANAERLTAFRHIGKAKDLLHSLVPRAQCFCFYAPDRRCIWSSDGAEDYEIDDFVDELPDDIFGTEEGAVGFLRRSLPSGRTVLVLPVRTDEVHDFGLLIGVFSKNDGKS